MKNPLRIRFGPRDYVDVADQFEVDALKEALMIREHWHPNGELEPFSPYTTHADVVAFLKGRRHALSQSLRSLKVSNQTYEERIKA